MCNLGVVLGQGVWGVSIRRAATIGPSRVARQLVPLVIGTCSSQSRGRGYQDPSTALAPVGQAVVVVVGGGGVVILAVFVISFSFKFVLFYVFFMKFAVILASAAPWGYPRAPRGVPKVALKVRRSILH